jgi:hypothetical protein
MSLHRLPSSPLKPVQALNRPGPASSSFWKCLRELRHVCGTKMMLPTSYFLSDSLLNIDPRPVASGGSGDVYEGTLNDSRVCVKRVRVYSRDGPEKATKVCYRCHHFPCLPLLTKPTDRIPGGGNVEMLGTQKHRPTPWNHSHSSSAYLRVDARREPDAIHQETPQHGPT